MTPFRRKRSGRRGDTEAPMREAGSIARGPCPSCGEWKLLQVAGCCAACSQPEVRPCELEGVHVA